MAPGQHANLCSTGSARPARPCGRLSRAGVRPTGSAGHGRAETPDQPNLATRSATLSRMRNPPGDGAGQRQQSSEPSGATRRATPGAEARADHGEPGSARSDTGTAHAQTRRPTRQRRALATPGPRRAVRTRVWARPRRAGRPCGGQRQGERAGRVPRPDHGRRRRRQGPVRGYPPVPGQPPPMYPPGRPQAWNRGAAWPESGRPDARGSLASRVGQPGTAQPGTGQPGTSPPGWHAAGRHGRTLARTQARCGGLWPGPGWRHRRRLAPPGQGQAETGYRGQRALLVAAAALQPGPGQPPRGQPPGSQADAQSAGSPRAGDAGGRLAVLPTRPRPRRRAWLLHAGCQRPSRDVTSHPDLAGRRRRPGDRDLDRCRPDPAAIRQPRPGRADTAVVARRAPAGRGHAGLGAGTAGARRPAGCDSDDRAAEDRRHAGGRRLRPRAQRRRAEPAAQVQRSQRSRAGGRCAQTSRGARASLQAAAGRSRTGTRPCAGAGH